MAELILIRERTYFEEMEYLSASSNHVPVPAARHRHPVLLALLVAFCLPAISIAQPKFQLKRTTREATPFMVRLYGGYNGMTEPSDALQDKIEGTIATSWGGLQVGLQLAVIIDTIGVPFWLGGEVSNQRIGKRHLAKRTDVFYSSDSTAVGKDEYIGGFGMQFLLFIDPFQRTQIILGCGALYFSGRVDSESDVTGLIPEIWMGTATAGISYAIFKYEHGSIDTYFRLTKGFGTFGSLHFQSLLCFTFAF